MQGELASGEHLLEVGPVDRLNVSRTPIRAALAQLAQEGLLEKLPHGGYAVLARGLLNHLFTRIYFAGDPANVTDPVLSRVPAERRGTLLAQPMGGEGVAVYRFDIVLQGQGETVFFNL